MPIRIRDKLDELRTDTQSRSGSRSGSGSGSGGSGGSGGTELTYNVEASTPSGGGSESESRPQVTEPTQQNTATYFSTGERPVLVDETEWSPPIGFGFLAETINIRFTDALAVAFAEPYTRGSQAIALSAEESPMTIGGAGGLQTAFMWVKKSDSAEEDPLVQIIAYK